MDNKFIRIRKVIGPLSPPVNDAIYLGRTALEAIGASNTISHPLHFYSEKMSEVKSNYYWCVKEKPEERFIEKGKRYVIPEYAFLQAVAEDWDDQPIFESLVYFYGYQDDFPERVRTLNKELQLASTEQLEYFLDFWGEGVKHG